MFSFPVPKTGGHVCGSDNIASLQNPWNTLLIARRVSRNRAGTRDPTLSSTIQLALSFYPDGALSPSTFSRGIRNGEHAAVQRLRERHATTSALSLVAPSTLLSFMSCLVPGSMAANLLFSFPFLTSLSSSSPSSVPSTVWKTCHPCTHVQYRSSYSDDQLTLPWLIDTHLRQTEVNGHCLRDVEEPSVCCYGHRESIQRLEATKFTI